MPTIKVQVKEKIAKNLTPEVVIVGGNSDYVIEFEFDGDWSNYVAKTAIFVVNEEPQEVEFKGNTCEVPVIENATLCMVGVEAGDLRTTTSAYIECKKSIRDEAQNAFGQSGGEKYLTNYQKKVDERLETESKEVVGAINEVNAKVEQGGGGGNADLKDYVKFTDLGQGLKRDKSNGLIYTEYASKAMLDNPTAYYYQPITPVYLYYAVKVGMTTNTETLTDEEKTKACDWLGAIPIGEPNGSYVVVYTQRTDGTIAKYIMSDRLVSNSIPMRSAATKNFYVGTPQSEQECANKDFVENLPDYLTLTDEQKAKWLELIGALKAVTETTATEQVYAKSAAGAPYMRGVAYVPQSGQIPIYGGMTTTGLTAPPQATLPFPIPEQPYQGAPKIYVDNLYAELLARIEALENK